MTFFRRALALKISSAGGVSKRGALGPPLSRKFWDFQGTRKHSEGLQIWPKLPTYLVETGGVGGGEFWMESQVHIGPARLVCPGHRLYIVRGQIGLFKLNVVLNII